MEIVLATGNDGKRKEMVSGMRSLSGVTWKSLRDFSPVEEPEENGLTFEENAILKADYYSQKLGQICLGEDSGLILDAFPDKFGLKTRREIEAKDDIDWLRIFLEIMEDQENRRATFYSALAYADPKTKQQHVVLGTVSGEIAEFPMAPIERGVPVSAVFIPDGSEDVFSGMAPDEKSEYSHRGKACKAMTEYLTANI